MPETDQNIPEKTPFDVYATITILTFLFCGGAIYFMMDELKTNWRFGVENVQIASYLSAPNTDARKYGENKENRDWIFVSKEDLADWDILVKLDYVKNLEVVKTRAQYRDYFNTQAAETEHWIQEKLPDRDSLDNDEGSVNGLLQKIRDKLKNANKYKEPELTGDPFNGGPAAPAPAPGPDGGAAPPTPPVAPPAPTPAPQ